MSARIDNALRILQTPSPLAKSPTHADMGLTSLSPTGPPERGKGPIPKAPCIDWHRIETNVAKVTPGEFVNQVRAEGRKVVWPSMKETRTTAIMVLIMTTLLAVFFFGVDSALSAIVKWLLGLIG